MIGTVLGERYEILEIVGSGGMAIVYKAKDRLLDRFVAVKMLREELQDDKEFVERFKAEARSAASLNHPNVVSVFDVGTDGDREYFVMEYIEGVTLKEIIESKTLTWKRSCSYGVQIAGAIEHAHKKNIVHRDIKPHNIMITKDNVVKVTDFGIARAVTTSTIVRAGNVIGSVHYFSPEQACGGAVDFKSDIYSMGVVLYEMLTGRVPFDAENPVAIAKMHVDNPPQPPIELNDAIPETLSDIVLKAMAKQPMKRYQTPSALAADLKQVVSNPTSISVKDVDATQFVPVVQPSTGGGYIAEKENKVIIGGNNNDEPVDTGRKTASKLAWLVAVFVFVLCMFIIVGAVNPSLFGFGERIEVPELRGLTVEQAAELCAEKGFEVQEAEGDYSDEYGQGQIMEQKPGAGTARKTKIIEVKISKGSSKISLMDYTGEDINVVKAKLD
ncbi:MAG: Stk1 family PASTA domain-containing Ser/Thr kinase, partial [Clostridia bacterium]|nr:Stk1 family PASTA domain-containing Ser/Thr kinase [Clostridia bacterium]